MMDELRKVASMVKIAFLQTSFKSITEKLTRDRMQMSAPLKIPKT